MNTLDSWMDIFPLKTKGIVQNNDSLSKLSFVLQSFLAKTPFALQSAFPSRSLTTPMPILLSFPPAARAIHFSLSEQKFSWWMKRHANEISHMRIPGLGQKQNHSSKQTLTTSHPAHSFILSLACSHVPIPASSGVAKVNIYAQAWGLQLTSKTDQILIPRTSEKSYNCPFTAHSGYQDLTTQSLGFQGEYFSQLTINGEPQEFPPLTLHLGDSDRKASRPLFLRQNVLALKNCSDLAWDHPGLSQTTWSLIHIFLKIPESKRYSEVPHDVQICGSQINSQSFRRHWCLSGTDKRIHKYLGINTSVLELRTASFHEFK